MANLVFDPGTLAAIVSGDSSSALLSPAIVSPSSLVDWGYPDVDPFADGVAVDSTRNLVTAANNYTATTTARPTMKRGPNGINSRAAFSFDGVANTLAGVSGLRTQFNNVPGVSLLVVVQYASASPGTSTKVLMVGDNAASSRASIGATTMTRQIAGKRLDADSVVTNNSAALSTAPTILFAVWDYVAGKQRLWMDGGLSASAAGSLSSSGGNCSATDPAALLIGSINASQFLAGLVGARALWNSAIAPTASSSLSGDVLTLIRSWGVSYGIPTA